MRTIDADALIDYLQIIPIDLGYREVEDVKKYVEQMPTIERKRGTWINDQCSSCGYGVKPWNNTPFCPRCGADMRGDEE